MFRLKKIRKFLNNIFVKESEVKAGCRIDTLEFELDEDVGKRLNEKFERAERCETKPIKEFARKELELKKKELEQFYKNKAVASESSVKIK